MANAPYIPNPKELSVIPVGGFHSDFEKDTRIRVEVDDGSMWDWCKDNLAQGAWKYSFPLVGSGASYHFKHRVDAVAFKLRFNVL
jgi:hypothetical protein